MTPREKVTLGMIVWVILMAVTFSYEEGYLQFCVKPPCNWEMPND